MNIPYAVAGAMAFFFHGYRRFTEDVDILVTPDGLARIHDSITGHDYVPCSQRNKDLRDLEFGVKVEFMVTGDFPGDGKPKPIAFPDPAQAGTRIEGINFLTLPWLVDLKLASGINTPGRLRDLADVQEMMKRVSLPVDFVNQLHPYVREKFTELWTVVQQFPEEPVEWTIWPS